MEDEVVNSLQDIKSQQHSKDTYANWCVFYSLPFWRLTICVIAEQFSSPLVLCNRLLCQGNQMSFLSSSASPFSPIVVIWLRFKAIENEIKIFIVMVSQSCRTFYRILPGYWYATNLSDIYSSHKMKKHHQTHIWHIHNNAMRELNMKDGNGKSISFREQESCNFDVDSLTKQ